ncbi:MAG: hypothetical protein HAW62_04725, partial [Endozoicomonadaceae bacterium]|nr:hypothetical protein [Endozoicomonadaceae bacterium]
LQRSQISHETIYQYIKKQRALGSNLYKNLRHLKVKNIALNGLSRQYLPKKTEFIGIDIDNDEILAIQKALNNRPRKVLNYRTPNEVMRGIEKPLGVALHG